MNAIQLDEPRVLEIMRREQAKAQARADELWERMKVAEAEMKPFKDIYDVLVQEWSQVHGMAQSLAACLAAKAQEASAA